MKLNFDKNSLRISSRKVITCVISIEPINGINFPEERWNDNIVNILSSWLENMLTISKHESNEVQFVFFDGPFSFKLFRENTEFGVTLFQHSREMGTFRINFSVFSDNLFRLSQEILEEAKLRGWVSDDLKQLGLVLRKYQVPSH